MDLYSLLRRYLSIKLNAIVFQAVPVFTNSMDVSFKILGSNIPNHS